MHITDFKDVLDVLGKDGTFSKIIKGYEYRDEQIELSEKITEALNENKILLAEAGTGVGKTMAYLIPGIIHAVNNGPLIISTNTINLQSQLMDKDIPDASFAMPDRFFKTILVKGRNNYVCHSLVDDLQNSLMSETIVNFSKFKKWLKKTKTGELQDLSFAFPQWYEVASNTHACKGAQCPYKQSGMCFYYNMQKKIAECDIIITNHSLFFSDLAAKQSDPYAGILPYEFSAVIIDEAHHIEDNASKVFGYEFSSFNIPMLIKRLKNRTDFNVDQNLLLDLDKLNKNLFESIGGELSGDYFLDEVYGRLGESNVKDIAKKLVSLLNVVDDDLENAKKDLPKDVKQNADRFQSMAIEIRDAVANIFFNGHPEDNFSWGETRPGDKYSDCNLYSTPIDVAEILRETLFSLGVPTIMTSATLTTSKKTDGFDYIKGRIGLRDKEEVETVSLDAPFDYMKNALLYVPRELPEPNMSEYTDKAADIIKELIEYAKGNVFVLFTSYKMLQSVYDKISIMSPYRIIRQGESSNEDLIKQFKANEGLALFGVSSFWEGIDVKGERLSMVIIDKIPFPVPSSPLVKSKCDFIDNNGGNSFMDYSVPCACIKLKQGFGRLIRTKTDRGVVAILDSRIHTKRYRMKILNSIPRCKGVTKLEKVKEFLEN